jgi:hypothetical protein
VVHYSSLVNGLRRIFVFVSSHWRKTLFLVVESILRKFARFFPLEGFPRVNIVYVVDIILSVILYM